MALRVKEEYIDSVIFDPISKNNISVRFIDRDLYNYFNNNGYSIIFEEDLPVETPIKKKKK